MNILFSCLVLAEFRDKIDKVAGNDIKIWDGFKKKELEQWIERWEDKKKLSEREWYSNYYTNFYDKTYLPYMDNFASYLLKGEEATKSDFWRWFLNTYLRENRYP